MRGAPAQRISTRSFLRRKVVSVRTYARVRHAAAMPAINPHAHHSYLREAIVHYLGHARNPEAATGSIERFTSAVTNHRPAEHRPEYYYRWSMKMMRKVPAVQVEDQYSAGAAATDVSVRRASTRGTV
jgi:hypothetical protein